MSKKTSVTVAWLDPGDVRSDFCVSICDLFRTRSEVVTGRVVVRSGGGITRGRNRAVYEFLEASDDEWMLFVDSDMKFTAEAFDKVLAAAHPKKAPVVGGLCFGQSGYHAGPFATLVPTLLNIHPDGGYLPMWDYPDDALVEVDATGAAFLLIHRSVLLEIKRIKDKGNWSWFHEHTDDSINAWVSEDISFCETVREAGFKIHVHTGSKIGHVKGMDYILTEEMYRILQGASGAANT